MNLKLLQTFVTVAEQGTVSKAANALGVTPPALSRQINELEQELGFKLFERVGRRLRLTAHGEQIIGDCRRLLGHAAVLNERAQALQRADLQVLKVVATAHMIEAVFPSFLHRYAEHAPDVKLTLIEANPTEHFSMLEGGQADLSTFFAHPAHVRDDRFGSYWLPHFTLAAACAPSRAVEHSDAIDIRRLAELPLLLMKPSFSTRTLFDAVCRLAGVAPSVVLESAASHTLLALAEADHGVAIVPSIVRTERRALKVMRVIHKGEPVRIAPAILWDRRRTPSPFAKRFSELLTAHILEVFPQSRPTDNPQR